MLNKTAISLILLASLAPATAQTGASRAAVAGEKVDSGLGSLPPFIEWQRHPQLRHLAARPVVQTTGEKRDSGLGELPPYEQWSRHPQLRHLVASDLAPTPVAGRGDGSGALAQAAR